MSIIDKIVDLQDEIYQDIVTLESVSHEIRQVIESVEDDRERQLLQYRYIDGLSWEQVAVTMGYGWRHVHKLHSKALIKLKMA